MSFDRAGRVREIHGARVDDVLKAHAEVQRSAREQPHRRKTPWISGSFYLATFLAIVMVLLVLGKIASAWTLPVVVVGGIIAVSVIGALQLRHDDQLGEQNFTRLMLAALARLPSDALKPLSGETRPGPEKTANSAQGMTVIDGMGERNGTE
jgi:hypothetical protein